MIVKLTGRPPVEIEESQWDTAAETRYSAHDGCSRLQSFRTLTVYIKILKHADGRTIVCGAIKYTTAYPNEPDLEARRGYLLKPGDSIWTAVYDTARELEDMLVGIPIRLPYMPALAHDCIQSLEEEKI